MKRRTLIKGALTGASSLYLSRLFGQNPASENSPISGPFLPTWDSLTGYKTPEWFRDAKFGIWAHWGPQCQPEHGDWYARLMYIEGSDDYKYHVKKYGHPSKFGFKDVINEWKAENWNPEELMSLYKNAGARYFMALANHHDNFDNYNSRYQRWNSTRLGPKKDLIGGWAKAAKNNDLKFGVSVHAAHAWMFYQTAQGADKAGPFAGVQYDGNITKESGKNTWWEDYDPQELYAQRHPVGLDGNNQWDWTHGASVPDKAYCEKFFNRTIDLIDKYNPDLVYFDDTVLPLYPISDVGLRIAAHLYNRNIKKNNGKLGAVLTGKVLNEQQRKCMVWDIERGQSNRIEPLPWQTDTCIGNWHYDRQLYENGNYKSAKTVIHTLIDVVSKNGNLMLNIPVRGDGTIDDKERAVVEEIGAWMHVNNEGIYGTRPWVVYGEGPAMEASAPLNGPGFNEGKGKPFGAKDVRFTTKGKTLYAIVLGWPEDKTVLMKKLAGGAGVGTVGAVGLLGSNDKLDFRQTASGLYVQVPDRAPCKDAFVLKIEGAIG